MKNCLDKTIGEKLYAYELGLLSEDERAEFEAHLLDCEYCFERAGKLEGVPSLLNHDSDIRETTLAALVETQPHDQSRPAPAKRSWPKRLFSLGPVPAVAFVAVVVLLLVLQPWGIRIAPSSDAYAAADRLLILRFDDVARDDRSHDQLVTDLLTVSLSESNVVRVVPNHEITEVCKRLDIDQTHRLDEGSIEKIARATRASHVLRGRILQTAPSIVLAGELESLRPDSVIATQRVEIPDKSDVFGAVDAFAREVENDFAAAQTRGTSALKPVAEITTSSVDAYNLYLAGREAQDKNYIEEATTRYREALALDSTFAMAWYSLAVITRGQQRAECIAKAEKYAANIDRRGRFYIRARQAQWSGDIDGAVREFEKALQYYPDDKETLQLLGQIEYQRHNIRKALTHFNRVIAIDPDYPPAYNMLAYTYALAGDTEGMEWALGKYVALVPDQANPYDTKGDLLLRAGNVDSAVKAFEKAVRINPDFYQSRQALAVIYMERGQFDLAQKQLEDLAESSDPGVAVNGILGPIVIQVLRGKLADANDSLDRIIASRENNTTRTARYVLAVAAYMKGQILMELGDCTAAEREILQFNRQETALGHPFGSSSENAYLRYLADCGGESSIDKLSHISAEKLSDSSNSMYWALRMATALGNGKPREATSYLERAEQIDKTVSSLLVAQVYLETGQLDLAIERLEKLRDALRFTINPLNVQARVKLHYLLGRAYEKSNWTNRAIEEYRTFLGYWNDPNSQLESVDDARARLQKLTR